MMFLKESIYIVGVNGEGGVWLPEFYIPHNGTLFPQGDKKTRIKTDQSARRYYIFNQCWKLGMHWNLSFCWSREIIKESLVNGGKFFPAIQMIGISI